VADSTRLATAGKAARFLRMLRELPPGPSEWAIHPGLGTAEARAVDGWWAKRAADLRFLVSREARETVAAEGIVLLDYRPPQAVWGRDRSRHQASRRRKGRHRSCPGMETRDSDPARATVC
jgi:hypothetical protein